LALKDLSDSLPTSVTSPTLNVVHAGVAGAGLLPQANVNTEAAAMVAIAARRLSEFIPILRITVFADIPIC
jgi:hypothetical protein